VCVYICASIYIYIFFFAYINIHLNMDILDEHEEAKIMHLDFACMGVYIKCVHIYLYIYLFI